MADFSTSQQFVWNGTAIAAQLEAAIEAGLEETAVICKAQMIERCPVGADHRDGSTHLYEEIDARVERTGSSATVILEANKDYASFVILGTSRTPAQDFMRPVADAEFPRIGERVKAALGGIR